MSVSYWGIVGYGIRTSSYEKWINTEKVRNVCNDLNPNTEFGKDVFEDNTFCGDPYYSFAEFVCELDKTHTLTYDENGSGESYLLYSPRYSWQMKDNEPQSYEEIEDRILDCLEQVCDKPRNELREEIDFICDAGWA